MQARFGTLFVAMASFWVLLVLAPGGTTADATRTISLYNIHTKETVTSTYKRNGRYVPEEMEKVNWALRDWRKNEATNMDPTLIDLLWEVHSEWIASPSTSLGLPSRHQRMLRKSAADRRAKAGTSGKAAEARFRRAVKNLRYSVLFAEGGVATSTSPSSSPRHRSVRPFRPAACRAGAAVPERPHAACSRGRGTYHARGCHSGTRRQQGARGPARPVPRAARQTEAADPDGVARPGPAQAAERAAACRAAERVGCRAER